MRHWTEEEIALLTLSYTDGIGPVLGNALLETCGTATSLLQRSRAELLRTPGVSPKLATLLSRRSEAERLAQAQMEAIDRTEGRVKPIFIHSDLYPERLRFCVDAPLLLYLLGTSDVLTAPHIISIVGTRRITPYGHDALRDLLTEVARLVPDTVVVSGMAYGVDITAHRTAMACGLRTVAVVAHGHHTLYPNTHKPDAERLCREGGALVSEYPLGTRALPQRFVARNRIIAALSDATLVVESARKGGSLITANIAFDYGRQVFALPGRIFDSTSEGCNHLIAHNKATLFTSASRMLSEIGYIDTPDTCRSTPIPFPDAEHPTTPTDDPILSLLHEVGELRVDDIALRTGQDLSTVSARLFDLELDGFVRALPGARYALVGRR